MEQDNQELEQITSALPSSSIKTRVRKITMSEETQQQAAMIISKYHPNLLLDGKMKTDELLSIIIAESIDYLYNNKLLPALAAQ